MARYIHELSEWPNFRWDAAMLVHHLGALRLQQGRLLGQMAALGFSFRSEANVENLTAEVVKSSAIEGRNFDAGAVRSSVARRMGVTDAGSVRPDRDIEGAVEMLLDATQNYAAVLTAERLLGWQASLFPDGRNGLQRLLTGAWRTPEMDPMQVASGPLSRDRLRRKNIHFEAPAASRIPKEVDRFLQWFETRDGNDQVLRAGIAHLWFVTIHPFQDGNGRVSRAIADMALARSEASALRFYSMSAQIEEERKQYYTILETTQKGNIDITEWLRWFLDCLGRAIARAESSLSRILRKATVWNHINASAPINERQRAVLNALLDGDDAELSTSRYAKLARCSLDTALRDIKQLVDNGVLASGDAGGRSTKYRMVRLDTKE